MQSFVNLIDEDFDESLSCLKEAVSELNATPKEVGKIDLFTLEFVTIIAKKLASSETIGGGDLVLHLADLDQCWKELPYPADFNSVGRLKIVEALVDLKQSDRAHRILNQIEQPLQGGRYDKAKERVDSILNNLK